MCNRKSNRYANNSKQRTIMNTNDFYLSIIVDEYMTRLNSAIEKVYNVKVAGGGVYSEDGRLIHSTPFC